MSTAVRVNLDTLRAFDDVHVRHDFSGTNVLHGQGLVRALRGAQPENGNTRWVRHGIAVQRHDFKRVTRQAKASNFRRAAV